MSVETRSIIRLVEKVVVPGQLSALALNVHQTDIRRTMCVTDEQGEITDLVYWLDRYGSALYRPSPGRIIV